jgi:hypothetical protein
MTPASQTFVTTGSGLAIREEIEQDIVDYNLDFGLDYHGEGTGAREVRMRPIRDIYGVLRCV